MKNKKFLFIYLLFLIFSNEILIAEEYTSKIRAITEKEFNFNYGNEIDIVNEIKKVLKNENLEISKDSVKLFEIKICDLGYIILAKITIKAIPFLQNYSLELYYDNYRNYIKSNFVDYNYSTSEKQKYPIDINSDNIGTNCEFN